MTNLETNTKDMSNAEMRKTEKAVAQAFANTSEDGRDELVVNLGMN